MQRIRIERKAPVRDRSDRYAVLPLDPRDPDIVRAKGASPVSLTGVGRVGRR